MTIEFGLAAGGAFALVFILARESLNYVLRLRQTIATYQRDIESSRLCNEREIADRVRAQGLLAGYQRAFESLLMGLSEDPDDKETPKLWKDFQEFMEARTEANK